MVPKILKFAPCLIAFKPVYYRRYVDDIFVLLLSSDSLNSFKDYLNKKHTNIHFTSEEEDNDELPSSWTSSSKELTALISLQYTESQLSVEFIPIIPASFQMYNTRRVLCQHCFTEVIVSAQTGKQFTRRLLMYVN